MINGTNTTLATPTLETQFDKQRGTMNNRMADVHVIDKRKIVRTVRMIIHWSTIQKLLEKYYNCLKLKTKATSNVVNRVNKVSNNYSILFVMGYK